MRGAILGLLAVAYHFLTICLHFPYHCLLTVTCAGWIARCEGSHFGVAGGCLPYPYHLLTISFQFAYYLLNVQVGEQDVGGAILGLLAVAYHFFTICLHFPYHWLTICYMRRMDSKMRSHFGVDGGCLPYPYHLLTLSSPFAYYLLHVQDG